VNKPDGSEKDSLRNAKPVAEGGTAQFVVNVASEAYVEKVAACAEPLPYGESEFAFVGLTPAPCVRVRAPRVAESPVSFECETLHVIRTNPGKPGGGNVVIGRVVYVHLADGLADERLRIDPDRLAAVARMGGTMYARTRERFELPPGRAALGLRPLEGRP
jgi:flavin reductase (DIM6/NTAB) family NADH-FMN oxidoreductase RutF